MAIATLSVFVVKVTYQSHVKGLGICAFYQDVRTVEAPIGMQEIAIEAVGDLLGVPGLNRTGA